MPDVVNGVDGGDVVQGGRWIATLRERDEGGTENRLAALVKLPVSTTLVKYRNARSSSIIPPRYPLYDFVSYCRYDNNDPHNNPYISY
jgi:hypothetical protein